MSAILANEPADLEAAGSALPPAVARIVRRCLEKSAGLRFQSAHDLAFALENAMSPSSAVGAPQPSLAPRTGWASRRLPVVLAMAAGAAIGAAAVARLAPRNWGDSTLVLGRTIAVTHETGLELHPSLSPDGALVAYAAGPSDQMHIYVRQVAGGRAIRSSFWSIPSAGGAPTQIVLFDDPTRESNRSEFTTDGTRLYFTLAQKEGDVWVMEIAGR